MDLAIIEQEALKLSDSERAVLVDHLLNTLGSAHASIMDAWAKEGAQRLDAFISGKTGSADGAEFIQSLREN